MTTIYGIRKEDLERMRADGWTVEQIAQHYGCSEGHINDWVREWKLYKNRTHDLDLDELVRLYEEEHMTIQQIADLFGCQYNSIWTRIRHVAKLRPRARRRGTYTGPGNNIWKGGIRIVDGYIRIRWHDTEDFLHRIIARDVMGFDLGEDDHVHHMDRRRCNNDPENLLVCTQTEHAALHAAMRRNPVLDQRKWLEEYRAEEQNRAA